MIDVTGSRQLLKDSINQSHYIEIRVRLNGKYYWFEGDFLKDLLKIVEFKKERNGVEAKLKTHLEGYKAGIKRAQTTSDMICPFCNQEDFDLIARENTHEYLLRD